MSIQRCLLIAGAFLLVLLVWWPILQSGSRIDPVADNEVPLLHFIDTKTGEIFPMRSRERIEKHPQTGEKTLYPGMYCEKCNKWRLVPNLDSMQSNPATRNCPIHRIPMVMVRDNEA